MSFMSTSERHERISTPYTLRPLAPGDGIAMNWSRSPATSILPGRSGAPAARLKGAEIETPRIPVEPYSRGARGARHRGEVSRRRQPYARLDERHGAVPVRTPIRVELQAAAERRHYGGAGRGDGPLGRRRLRLGPGHLLRLGQPLHGALPEDASTALPRAGADRPDRSQARAQARVLGARTQALGHALQPDLLPGQGRVDQRPRKRRALEERREAGRDLQLLH